MASGKYESCHREESTCETCGTTFKYFPMMGEPDECTDCHLGVPLDAPRHRDNDKSRDIDGEVDEDLDGLWH